MKKWVCLLALCLCLNGTLALASEVEPAAPAAGAAQTEAVQEAAEAGEPPAAGGENAGPTAEEMPAAEVESAEQGEAPASQNPASENPTSESPANENPTGENPGSENPASESPASESPASENPASESPASESPAGENPTGENPASESPASGNADGAATEPASADAQDAGDAGEAPAGAPTEAPADAVPEDAQAWFEADGAKVGGTLEALLPQLTGKVTLNLIDKNIEGVARVKDLPLKALSEVTLKLDPEDDSRVIRVSRSDPAGVERPETIALKDLSDCAGDERGDLFIWIEDAAQPTPQPTATPEPVPVLSVSAEKLSAGAWSNEAPSFTLSGIPEGKAYSYAAVIYDERIVPLSGNAYAPDMEGRYSVRFAMVDGIGDIVSASETYPLWLDFTAPKDVMIEYDDASDYTLHITATDGLSGVTGVSFDGGATWEALSDGEEFTYTAAGETTLSPGTVQVRDAAGNLWRSTSEIRLEAVTPEPGGGGGGGGGSGEKKPVQSHASGDGEEGVEYEALELELPAEPMKKLTVGGEEMELTLVLESARAEGAPVGEEQPFTAALARWQVPADADDPHENVLADAAEPAPNTLVLTAKADANLGDAFAYTWRFNGEVYRLLANSGIRYVALRVGDDVAAFPTEGFTGGTKYTELKMLGVSTRKFDYTLTMRVNLDPGYVSAMSDCDFSRSCDLSIRAEVENMAYELSASTNSLMYFYDVYLGPEAMLDAPFGQYRAD